MIREGLDVLQDIQLLLLFLSMDVVLFFTQIPVTYMNHAHETNILPNCKM